MRKERPSPLGLTAALAVPARSSSFNAHRSHLHGSEEAAGPATQKVFSVKAAHLRRRNSMVSPVFRQVAGSPLADGSHMMELAQSFKWPPRSPINEEGSVSCDFVRRTSSGSSNEPCEFRQRSCSVLDLDRRTSSAVTSHQLRPTASAEQDFCRTSSAGSASAGSPGCSLSLPKWPHLDPAAFRRGKALLGSMEMDPTCFSRDDLCHLALEIFEAAGLPDELAADLGRVRRFILAIRESMYDNAYHNFYHVFDVTQTVSVIARRTGTLDRLNAWERFALLAAALCHDLEHPGVTSIFLDRAGASVAGAFKDTVLEKHHVIRAFEVMVGQDIGLLKGLSSDSYWDFRNAVAGCILATDIAKHSSYCDQVRELVQEGASRPSAKQLEMELIIKCADISNVLKPFHIARRWALRVTDEFFAQGDVELARGMEVTPICDRRTQSRVGSQVGFIKFVSPFFESMATLYPALRPDVNRMHLNSESWASHSDAALEETRDHESTQPPSGDSDHDHSQSSFVSPAASSVSSPTSRVSSPTMRGATDVRFTPGLQKMVSRLPSSHQEALPGCPGGGHVLLRIPSHYHAAEFHGML